MPKPVGKVEMYRLRECPEGCNHNRRGEECERHTKEETDALLNQLREDLSRGGLITLRWKSHELRMRPNGAPINGEPEGHLTVSEDGQFIHVEHFQPAEHMKGEYDIQLWDVLSVEIDYLDSEDEDEHPLVYWRHEIDFCDLSRFFRTEYMPNTRPKDWERELSRCKHTYEMGQPEKHDDAQEEDINERERHRLERRDRQRR